MTMPGLSTGKRLSTASSAWVPPVEVPRATTRSVVSTIARDPGATPGNTASAVSLAATLTGAAACLGVSAMRRTRARAAALTTETRSSPPSSKVCFKAALGLATMLTAPAAMACMVVSAPCVVNVEQITTGVGRSFMILRRKVTPSMRGISTSSTMTSGHSLFMRSMAKTGSGTAPMTEMPLSADNSCVTT